LSSGELSDEIHTFHNGPNRELFKLYNEPTPLDSAVAHAIVTGVLDETKIEPGLLEYLASAIRFRREKPQPDPE
jgi:hypothetical protein